MEKYNDLDKFGKAAVHAINNESGYSDKEFYDYYINAYHCEKEQELWEEEKRKLKVLSFRIDILKRFGLVKSKIEEQADA